MNNLNRWTTGMVSMDDLSLIDEQLEQHQQDEQLRQLIYFHQANYVRGG